MEVRGWVVHTSIFSGFLGIICFGFLGIIIFGFLLVFIFVKYGHKIQLCFEKLYTIGTKYISTS